MERARFGDAASSLRAAFLAVLLLGVRLRFATVVPIQAALFDWGACFGLLLFATVFQTGQAAASDQPIDEPVSRGAQALAAFSWALVLVPPRASNYLPTATSTDLLTLSLPLTVASLALSALFRLWREPPPPVRVAMTTGALLLVSAPLWRFGAGDDEARDLALTALVVGAGLLASSGGLAVLLARQKE